VHIETTRFGTVEVDDSRIISFPSGLLGFSSYRRFVLLQPDDDGVFYWLQSVEAPDLAFVVTDPSLWVPEYKANIRREQMDELQLGEVADAQVLAIVNKREETLTLNLQGPVVINIGECVAMQLVLADKRWSTRQEIVRLDAAARAVPA
jgi:flagellar assembly factor FliW